MFMYWIISTIWHSGKKKNSHSKRWPWPSDSVLGRDYVWICVTLSNVVRWIYDTAHLFKPIGLYKEWTLM